MITRRALFAAALQRTTRPNIVLLLADDLGSADLSSFGATDIRTPNIDSIAASGVKLTECYACPECSPTRASIMTARYPQRVGGLECAIGVDDVGRYDEADWLAKQGELGLPTSETSIATMLKKSGYDTALFGKWHLGYREKFWPNHHGFDETFGILGGNADYFKHTEENGRNTLFENGKLTTRTGYLTDLLAEAAIGWLKKRTAHPFFLYLPFNAPHVPIQDPDGKDPGKGRAIYAKMVERVDARVGDILAQLDRMGAANNTLVIFMSDNGADPNGSNGALHGRKSSVYEGGIRVPAMVRWPGELPQGKESAAVTLAMDIGATALAVARVKPARKLDGVNMLPAWRGGPEPQRAVFWRFRRGNIRRRAVREGSLKLTDDNGKIEMFDLAKDPREAANIADRPDHSASRARLLASLAAWEKDVQAPRLKDFRAPA